MNISPKVSIVIPAYNREKYIGMAIKSVLDQTYRDLELIVVDDGSRDGTLAIAEQFAREDDRVQVLSDKTNRGAAYALKKGFEAARGEYVGQVDSDDILEPQGVELTAAVLDDDIGCGLVYTNYVEISKNGHVLRVGRRCTIPYSIEQILTNFMIFHFRLMRKNTYKLSGGFDEDFAGIEDYELCLRLSEITQVKKIETILYQYRIHSEAIQATLGQVKRINLCEKAIKKALKRRNIDKTYNLEINYNPTFYLRKL